MQPIPSDASFRLPDPRRSDTERLLHERNDTVRSAGAEHLAALLGDDVAAHLMSASEPAEPVRFEVGADLAPLVAESDRGATSPTIVSPTGRSVLAAGSPSTSWEDRVIEVEPSAGPSPLGTLVAALARATIGESDARVRFREGTALGAPPGWGRYERLVACVEGIEHWRVTQGPDQATAAKNRTELRPGDVLHVPRGWWTAATSPSARSVTVELVFDSMRIQPHADPARWRAHLPTDRGSDLPGPAGGVVIARVGGGDEWVACGGSLIQRMDPT